MRPTWDIRHCALGPQNPIAFAKSVEANWLMPNIGVCAFAQHRLQCLFNLSMGLASLSHSFELWSLRTMFKLIVNSMQAFTKQLFSDRKCVSIAASIPIQHIHSGCLATNQLAPHCTIDCAEKMTYVKWMGGESHEKWCDNFLYLFYAFA